MGQSVSLSRGELVVHTLIVMTGAFMAILDTTIVDIALPKMMAPLKTDLYGIQWVVTAYMIAAAVVLPLLEWLEKVVGLKKMYVAGIALFALSSYLCGISTELYQMVVFRSIQGLAEALIIVSAQVILFTIYPPEQKGVAMGIFGLGASFAPAVGPTLGGWLTEHINWNWIFFINVPVGIVLTTAALFFLREVSTERKVMPFNFVSFTFISIATVSTLIVLSKGQQFGWFSSNTIAFLTVVALLCYLLYLASDVLSKVKLIDLSVFRKVNFAVSSVVFLLVLGFSMYALFYAIPLYFEFLKGLSTFTTGILLLPFALSIAVFSVVAGALSDRWSAGGTLFIAILVYLGSIFFFMRHYDLYTPKGEASLELSLMGVGMGLFFAPVTVIALRGLEDKTILVISLLDYIRFIGGSFGTAIATNILKGNSSFHYDEISALQSENYHFVVGRIESLAQFFVNTSYTLEEAVVKAYYSVGALQMRLSYSYAFQDLFVWSGIFAIVGLLPLVLLFRTWRYNKA
ncbi:DHA2 family efflux MFS transporter permease subunit [Hydrogenivirga sp. 128-5-R1-1]|uniref:DHA2 family efflux MFS transporter permease subunit n=1 Tax=Hydrogenivirga sp. 128-5-R1-1 TaxID=392423 RepID=UPI00015F3807|nr:DHA2 family efflux MFS transporter permease subunit [Hydrogenivirga sp. 128-5-R1-1]EDP76291.1 major facilitator family transporter [Hydrogenivirga sp. 128-5-R1-1]